MTCTACRWYYISRFFPDAPAKACLALNGCSGVGLGEAVRLHVAGNAPDYLDAPDVADGCPGFWAGEPIYTETP